MRLVPTERQVQRAILRMMGLCFRSCLVWHIPNGAFLGEDEKARRRTMGGLLGDGLKPGAPDLAVYWNHGHALLEVKRPGCANRLSDEQRRIHAELAEMGFVVGVVTSTEEAFQFLKDRGAPSNVAEWREVA